MKPKGNKETKYCINYILTWTHKPTVYETKYLILVIISWLIAAHCFCNFSGRMQLHPALDSTRTGNKFLYNQVFVISISSLYFLLYIISQLRSTSISNSINGDIWEASDGGWLRRSWTQRIRFGMDSEACLCSLCFKPSFPACHRPCQTLPPLCSYSWYLQLSQNIH